MDEPQDDESCELPSFLNMCLLVIAVVYGTGENEEKGNCSVTCVVCMCVMFTSPTPQLSRLCVCPLEWRRTDVGGVVGVVGVVVVVFFLFFCFGEKATKEGEERETTETNSNKKEIQQKSRRETKRGKKKEPLQRIQTKKI